MDKNRINIYVDSDIKEKIKDNSNYMGLTMNGFINVCILEYLKNNEAFIKFSKHNE